MTIGTIEIEVADLEQLLAATKMLNEICRQQDQSIKTLVDTCNNLSARLQTLDALVKASKV